ncbi:type ISP restriction/modification enzyme [Sutterella megalosphaeroides]
MRIAPNAGKKRGYVILPVVTPPGLAGEDALNNNKEFDVVWQVLRALKSIDNEFGAAVDPQLGKINSDKIEVVSLTEKKLNKKPKASGATGPKGKRGSKPEGTTDTGDQGSLFERDEVFEEHIRSRILKRVGNRREWGDWAEDVGLFCEKQVAHIEKVLRESETSRAAFESFKKELKATLNGELSDKEIVDMLGQHVVTQPILDALFTIRDDTGNIIYEFSKHNPIARAMTAMVDSLDKDGMRTAASSLKDFYESVQIRMRNVKTAVERQTVIKDLFEKFFKAAFPKLQEKLGIVYTPVEVVDFINRSVADLMKQEFGTNLYDDGVHILDPFSGTGTFLARLMQSGLIPQDKLPKKFATELHGNEIVPLAYYVASMNLEGVFHELCPNQPYAPNNVMLWTDTFADHGNPDVFKTALGENNERLESLEKTDVRVILGNPPYSAGQKSQNDNNQNEHYESLDARIDETYSARTDVTLKKLKDSYIRAYRWASDRIGDKGIIGFVANASWLTSSSANGMRKCISEEFNSIYVYNLKGNQRTSKEQSRKEGGKIFGEGSRSAIAIVLLIKNPDHNGKEGIFYYEVDDYLSKAEKLEGLSRTGSMLNVPVRIIIPDEYGDWFEHREGTFSKYYPIFDSKSDVPAIFDEKIVGVSTNRDKWVWGSSTTQIAKNIDRIKESYTRALGVMKTSRTPSNKEKITEARAAVQGDIAWSCGLLRRLERFEAVSGFDLGKMRLAAYRPFVVQNLYYDRESFVERPGRWSQVFRDDFTKNLIICFNQNWTGEGQIVVMTNRIADLHFNGDTQCFPRWIPRVTDFAQGSLCLGYEDDDRESGFSKDALPHFQRAYPGHTITEDDLFYYIYGILHSEEYRTRYANNLIKELPRIPRVATYEQFRAFADAGRKLADLHVNYEHVAPYAGVKLVKKEGNADYRVEQMKWGKIPGKKGNAAKDKTRLVYNDWLTIENIPPEAQEYVVNTKSALDWVVERACVSVDKDSGIVNDFNDYAAEIGDPRYPLDLFLKVITVSLETVKIVKGLPALEIHPLDA